MLCGRLVVVGDTPAAVRQFLEGHRAAAERQRRLVERRGARPEQAVAECLDALEALEEMQLWPGPRDPVSERGVQRVRGRWAKVKSEFRNADHRRRA